MKQSDFLKDFKMLLPDKLEDTFINTENIEQTTLLFIGDTISHMDAEGQSYFDKASGLLDDLLIDIVATKYKIEW